MKSFIILSVLILLTSCGGGDSSAPSVSSGLKIFATSSLHVGDFANDPFLSGSNAIEKADSFCNQDTNKPNESSYKALLIDVVHRDAKSLLDWVLNPNTTYYRSYDNIEIGTTDGNAIFPVLYKDLTNSIDIRRSGALPSGRDFPDHVWSGITDLTDYSVDGTRNCDNWTSASDFEQGIYGLTYETNLYSISTVTASTYCGARLHLYCVEQSP